MTDVRVDHVAVVDRPGLVGQVGDASVAFLKTNQLEGLFSALKRGEPERWIKKNGARPSQRAAH